MTELQQGTTPSAPQQPSGLDALSQSDLLARRAALIAKGNGKPQDLADKDLEELVQIIALLRRRSSGPPAAKSAKAKGPVQPLASLL